jgi:hypothetical protein
MLNCGWPLEHCLARPISRCAKCERDRGAYFPGSPHRGLFFDDNRGLGGLTAGEAGRMLARHGARGSTLLDHGGNVQCSDRFVLLGPSGSGKSSLPAGARPHDGASGVRPASAAEDGDAECDVPDAGERALLLARGGGAGRSLDRQGRPRRLRRHRPVHGVGLHEAARGHRSRHGDRAGHPADGGAVRRARPGQDAR